VCGYWIVNRECDRVAVQASMVAAAAAAENENMFNNNSEFVERLI